MTIRAVEGCAGTGKTTRLIEMLVHATEEQDLGNQERVLALTFMHGARRRLAARLHSVAPLKRRFDCMTLDKFAYRLYGRWLDLANSLSMPSPQPDDFDAVCDAAGRLLERAEVRRWVATSYPVLVVDEAQDLSLPRLRVIAALAESLKTIVAADEFQCLNEKLRPNPAVAWIEASCKPDILTKIHRTSCPGILTAASSLRAAGGINEGRGLKIVVAKGPAYAASCVTAQIAYGGTRDVAILTPSTKKFAPAVIELVRTKQYGKPKRQGPYDVRWEHAYKQGAHSIMTLLDFQTGSSASDVLSALRTVGDSGPVRNVAAWVRRQVLTQGRDTFSRAEIEQRIARQLELRAQYGGNDGPQLRALTIQQAKNREFDSVIVIWPYDVPTDPEHRRRLLYNAITRAKKKCLIIVQGPDLLKGAPFVRD